jgi:hypothetical protein
MPGSKTRVVVGGAATAVVLGACMAIATTETGQDAGTARARVSSLASVVKRPCFGAAARSPIPGCVDPGLRFTVFPIPEDASLQPSAPCQPVGRVNLLNPCGFGAPATVTKDTVALIGDSHASHWRAAVDVVAKAEGRPAISITRAGCPFTTARVVIPSKQAVTCRRWNRDLLAWLRRHHEVTTIFLSAHANAKYVQTHRNRTNFETAVRGHMALWRALPATVTSIIVIRDTPLNSFVAEECVRRTYDRGQRAEVRCARARSSALHHDPAVTAARRLRSRVHILDMTRFFCSPSQCYSVVGGALVYKDTDHITATFARTIGPFMLGKVADIVKNAA